MTLARHLLVFDIKMEENQFPLKDLAHCRPLAIDSTATTPQDKKTPNISNQSKQCLEIQFHSDEQTVSELTEESSSVNS